MNDLLNLVIMEPLENAYVSAIEFRERIELRDGPVFRLGQEL